MHTLATMWFMLLVIKYDSVLSETVFISACVLSVSSEIDTGYTSRVQRCADMTFSEAVSVTECLRNVRDWMQVLLGYYQLKENA